ncbi:MAG: hypothetical protein JWQ27_681 [Ferruginibacter sp.]|nr:hypothetical protein [Ferruginibacter sp.]
MLCLMHGALFSQSTNHQTELSSQSQFDSIRPYHHELAAVCKSGKWGFINKNGAIVITLMYSEVSDFVEGKCYAKAGVWYQLDSDGTRLSEVSERSATRFLPAKTPSISREIPSPLGNRVSFQGVAQTLTAGQCPPNIDFEDNNFANWYCYTGHVGTGAQGANQITYFNNNPPVNTPVPGRHTLIPRTTPAALDYYGKFPLNAPDGSGHVVKLGNDNVLDSAEKIRYVLQIPAVANDYSITFQYAVVLENPLTPAHTPDEKPRMQAQVIDAATGNILQCADFLYVAAGTIPGFFDSPEDPNVKCKSWTPVFVNLSAYAGRTLYLDFVTADCTLGAHFGYAYVDVGPCNQAIAVQYSCTPPNLTTLSGPPGFAQYNWWDNNYTTLLGTSQNLSLNPGPPINARFHLEVIPYNGISCKDTLTATVTAAFPNANAGTDQTICVGSSVTLGSSAIPGYNYQWSPAQYLNNAQVANPTSSAPSTTTYTLIVTDGNGCSSQDQVNVTVKPKPLALFSINNSTQCLNGNSVSFSNNSGFSGGSFTSVWTFGDGTFSAANSPIHSYISAGTYTVKLVVTSNTGCKDSISSNVTINPKPIISFSLNNLQQCFVGNRFVFINNSTINIGASMNFVWEFGDGNLSTATSPVHSYSSPGNYGVRITATSNNGCIDSAFASIKVFASPNAMFSVIQPDQCLNGNSFSFNNGSSHPLGGPLSYLWLFGDGNSSTLANPSYSFNSEGTYGVKLIAITTEGCRDTASHIVTVNPKPVALFSINNLTQCVNENRLLINNQTALSAGTLTYQWAFGDGVTSNQASPVHVYSLPGTYQVKLVSTTDKNCKDSSFKTVIINPNPVISIAANANIVLCKNNSVQLGAAGGLSYQWTPINGLNCNNCPNPIATPLISTPYVVRGINSFGCPGYDSTNITVMQPISIRSSNDSMCIGDSARLFASGATSYIWTPSQGLSNTAISNPIAFPRTTTSYRVVGYDGANCFTDTAYITVGVGQRLAINLGTDLNLSTGTAYNFTPIITNGPVKSWLWSPPSLLNCATCPKPIATIKKDITYTVSVRDIYGCTAADSIHITAFCEKSQVFIPNVFTPDGDGVNDILMIRAKGIVAIKYFRIFNRWGELIFEKTDFPPNNPLYSWDGKIRGVTGPPDVFVYTAEVVCENGNSFIYKGNTSIIR